MEIQTLFHNFCKENNLTLALSYDMPDGYETAFGTYDVTINTLFLNQALLQNAPDYEALFYLYHELRHAVQYLHPERFGKTIQDSLPYVILYNGVCFRLVDHAWRECAIPGTEEVFLNAYLSLPYERDANQFAYETVKSLLGDSSELGRLYAAWSPQRELPYDEHKALFTKIDEQVGLNKV